MTPDVAIEIEGLSKNFKSYPNVWAQLRDLAIPGRTRGYQDNWVLRDVSFRVHSGECLAIIGRNGSGKSTLLKIVTGVLHATHGSVGVNGRVVGLLELGTGFMPELTGRQNVELSCQLQGLPADYAAIHMGEIEAFADIGAFFDRPVKTYSSGMLVRVAFATFMFMNPDVFIVDEALSVGDLFFQQKCFDTIARLKAKGTTFLIVSHDMTAVRNLSDRVVLLEQGRVSFDGDPAEAVMQYYLSNQLPAEATVGVPEATGTIPATNVTSEIRAGSILTFERRMGNGALEIQAVRCCDEQRRDRLQFQMNEKLVIEAVVVARLRIESPNVGFEIYDKYNSLVFGVSLLNLGKRMHALLPGEVAVVRFEVSLSLMPGEYSISVATADQTGTPDPNAGKFLDRQEKLGPLVVSWGPSLMPFYGTAGLPATGEFSLVGAESETH